MGPVQACGLMAHGPVLASFISSLSLGTSQSPCLGIKLMFREGGPWGDGLLEPPLLSSAYSCSWDLVTVSLAGTGPSWPPDPRPGSGSRRHPSISPVHLAACLWPLSPFLNLGVPLGTERLAGPRANSSSAWGTLLLGRPVIQGHPGARELGRPPRKRARPDPPPPAPSPAQPSTSKVRPMTGQEQRPPAYVGCWSVCPAQGGRQERGPEWPARLGSSPEEQARAGVAATLSCLITYTYSF